MSDPSREEELELAFIRERLARQQAERERDEAQRAEYGSPCKCESWIAACREAEETRDAIKAQLTLSEQALSAERARKVDLGLRLGQILGREYDGVPLDEVARRFVASEQARAQAEQARARLRTALADIMRVTNGDGGVVQMRYLAREALAASTSPQETTTDETP